MTTSDLRGFTVGITADRRWEEQAELFSRRGATVVHGPTIRTLPHDTDGQLRRVTEELILDPPDVTIANTGIGIRSWLAAAESWNLGEALIGALGGSRLYVRGPKAAGALHQYGLEPFAFAAAARLSDLVELIARSEPPGARVAFQRHGNESPAVVGALEAGGAHVIVVPVYRWLRPEDERPAERLIEAVIERRVHAITFTSAPAVQNFASLADERGVGAALRQAIGGDVVVACVGEVCAGAAERAGFRGALVPESARVGPLIRLVADHLTASEVRVAIGDGLLSIRGTRVMVAGSEVTLSSREARVLAVLLRAAGTTVPKQSLLHAAWGGQYDDPHVVEVAVARLRRKLGPASKALIAVRRRGYRLAVER